MTVSPQPRRVVITAMGCITAAGLDLETNWQNLLAGKSAVTSIESIDTDGF